MYNAQGPPGIQGDSGAPGFNGSKGEVGPPGPQVHQSFDTVVCDVYIEHIVSVWFEAKVLLVNFVALLYIHEMAYGYCVPLHAHGFTDVYKTYFRCDIHVYSISEWSMNVFIQYECLRSLILLRKNQW